MDPNLTRALYLLRNSRSALQDAISKGKTEKVIEAIDRVLDAFRKIGNNDPSKKALCGIADIYALAMRNPEEGQEQETLGAVLQATYEIVEMISVEVSATEMSTP